MLCVLLLWLSFNSFWQDWQFSLVKVWLNFSLQFFQAEGQLDKRDPSLTWCRDLFYFYTSGTSFYSKRTHENNSLPLAHKVNITFLVGFFLTSCSGIASLCRKIQISCSLPDLPLLAAGMNELCRWEQPQHLAAHLLPPEYVQLSLNTITHQALSNLLLIWFHLVCPGFVTMSLRGFYM